MFRKAETLLTPQGAKVTEQISGPPHSVITSIHGSVTADVPVGLCFVFFFLNNRDVFHKVLCDFSGPGAILQQPAWG